MSRNMIFKIDRPPPFPALIGRNVQDYGPDSRPLLCQLNKLAASLFS